MDDGLDILFKQAQESISEPVPISEIRSKLETAPVAAAPKFWNQGRIIFVVVLACVVAGFLLLFDDRVSDEETGDENVVTTQEVTSNQEENEMSQGSSTMPEETPAETEIQEEATEESDVPAEETTPEEVLPTENETSLPNISENDTPASTDDQPAEKPTEKPTEAPTEKPSEKPAEKPIEKPAVAVVPTFLINKGTSGSHRYEFPSTTSKSEINQIKKMLRDYELTLNISTLKYDREWINEIKGDLEDPKTGRKAKFGAKSNDLDIIIITFDYSTSKGPSKMVVIVK